VAKLGKREKTIPKKKTLANETVPYEDFEKRNVARCRKKGDTKDFSTGPDESMRTQTRGHSRNYVRQGGSTG